MTHLACFASDLFVETGDEEDFGDCAPWEFSEPFEHGAHREVLSPAFQMKVA